ncbi:MAG: prepilin-type N-terminal cleavage/methylation domain-containing protein [bacterium]
MMPSTHTRSFTLIELLIVVAIIGILAAIAVPNFMNARLKATIAKVYAEEKSINDAYLMYNMDNSSWPPHIDGDIAQHRFVTTPIAYLNGSIVDPFQKEGVTAPDTIGWYKGQYHEEPGYQMRAEFYGTGDPAARRFADEHKSSAFFCRSVGPDMDRVSERTLPYDMSNGLVSQGTICTPLHAAWEDKYPFAR